MNGKINKPKGGNVYLTINSENKIIDILKSTAGIDGFRAFIDRNVERVMNKGVIPDA
ncbi:hypothetical protein [Alistipes indistinctus]|jgi:hypothetical protein|uniref:hypothetical protein n=1 Tax=Alistipes indistinctus TaxID=626932 RepID=UPI0015F34A93|nr:hypothetical protein [Alistipes indistinctus]